jgi:exodeoxyribonuclease VII small subunit
VNRNPGYREAMEEIGSIVNEIESETIDVDVLTQKVKRASALIKLCKEKLRKTEKEIKDILTDLEKPEGNK